MNKVKMNLEEDIRMCDELLKNDTWSQGIRNEIEFQKQLAIHELKSIERRIK